MKITVQEVMNLAPDSASASAGKKLASPGQWQELGRNDVAVWGLCQGSAVYQVKVETASLGYHCSCPSRKFPCKHVIGLLLIAVEKPDAAPLSEPPPFAAEWLAKRQAKQETAAAKSSGDPAKPVDAKAQQKRAAERTRKVEDGLARLNLWMEDLVRGGFAGLESKPHSFWEEQSKRLIDSQAPGLASRVARLADIPGADRNWHERLLEELGTLKLILVAYDRIASLPEPFADDIRQTIGWTTKETDLVALGESVEDDWIVFGQWMDVADHTTQYSWIVGRQSQRRGLFLQFAFSRQPFAESTPVGVEQHGVMLFYPGSAKQRVKFASRAGTPSPIRDRLPGFATIDAFLQSEAELAANGPWRQLSAGVLHSATFCLRSEDWCIRDSSAAGLRATGEPPWNLVAVAGGEPADIAVQWDGRSLRPLGLWKEGRYFTP